MVMALLDVIFCKQIIDVLDIPKMQLRMTYHLSHFKLVNSILLLQPWGTLRYMWNGTMCESDLRLPFQIRWPQLKEVSF